MPTPLEEALDLPSLEEILESAKTAKEQEELDKIHKAEQELEELRITSPQTATEFEAALVKTKKLEDELSDQAAFHQHDKDMDEISTEAMGSYQELKDLGMNVPPGHSAKIFESAVQMLRLAFDARNAKSDKKLRMWRLQLEQARLMRDLNRDRGSETGTIENEETIRLDRNKLLQELKEIKE